MGKRKSSKKVMKKERPKVMSKFDCPQCHSEGSIKISINKKIKTGQAKCGNCSIFYNCNITALSEPIDIYCEWVDAFQMENPDDTEPSSSRNAAPRYDDEDED